MTSITPVLLCGGSGTRLWPLSRKSYPKQFAQLLSATSLFQASARRLSGDGFAPPLVVTASDFRFIVTEQLAEAAIDAQAILIEPEGRNTAPAVLAAALWLDRTDPDALMLVAPSDHVIPDAAAFRAVLDTGARAARDGRMVTFGITPDRAETGYGWLELDAAPGTGGTAEGEAGVLDLVRFVEKPDAEQAQMMLDQGRFLWNAGIFLFSVRTILDAFRAHAPDLMGPVGQAVAKGRADLGFLRLDPAAWEGAQDISIDYAVMERADNLSVVPFGGCWSDLGDWHAVWREMGGDADGVNPAAGLKLASIFAKKAKEAKARMMSDFDQLREGIKKGGLEGGFDAAKRLTEKAVKEMVPEEPRQKVDLTKVYGGGQEIPFKVPEGSTSPGPARTHAD